MSRRSTSLFALAALSVSLVSAQSTFPPTPLADKHFAYPTGIPYMVDTDQGLIRGTQSGYNICNSTTEGPTALCQTLIVNSLDDFCVWAPSKPNSVVADTEGEMVAWCTKPGHGTRLIPAGALTGVQYMKTPDYIQLVGFIKQTNIDLQTDDFGGEMDPHGADLRGNPMGGIVYSNAWNGQYTQVIEWHNFMGGNAFCLKVCDPSRPNAANFCQHIYDRIGCAYNAPNAAQDGVFEACEGDNQDFPGVYTSNGVVQTYTQPPESLGAISTMPYTARIPASSNCTPFQSGSIYAALPTVAASGSSSASGSAATGLATSKSAGSAATSTQTGSSSAATASSDAQTLAISGVSLLGVVFSALFFS